MKELPKFVNKVQMEESEGLYELEIVLHQRAKNKRVGNEALNLKILGMERFFVGIF